ncbi:hypothetical protein TWF694_010083 [Orbilia ellipsospora]|uniref:F-box domain-containing protein n=1 Tax=Orbilia ellipsospora TaxID=2528407 RepID=A0AAV9X971_9PEZI
MAPNLHVAVLPLELHLEILSLLTINEQIQAEIAWYYWQDILLTNGYLKKSRYTSNPKEGVEHLHILLNAASGLICDGTNGIVQNYTIARENKSPLKAPRSISRIYALNGAKNSTPQYNIFESSILDETVLSPDCHFDDIMFRYRVSVEGFGDCIYWGAEKLVASDTTIRRFVEDVARDVEGVLTSTSVTLWLSGRNLPQYTPGMKYSLDFGSHIPFGASHWGPMIFIRIHPNLRRGP